MSTYEQVKQYANAGFSVFPLPYRSKKPFFKWNWRVLQQRRPTQDELNAWFSASRVNVAVVTGRVSGNLCVLDFDDLGAFSLWQENAGLMSRTAKTGKGVHVYFRITDPEHIRNGDFQVKGRHAGQCRFDGGYVVAPPSVHPDGERYHWRVEGPVLSVSCAALHVEQKTQKGLAEDSPERVEWQEHINECWHVRQRPDVRHPESYAHNAIDKELESFRAAGPGTRNNALFRSSLKLSRFRGVLPDAVIFDRLVSAGLDSGLPEGEVNQTILKAWKTARY